MEQKISHEINSTSRKVITKRPDGSIRVQTINSDQTITDPQWKKESDINYIMEKFQKTGTVTHSSNRQGVYADVSQVPDLLTAAIIVKEASDKFAELPSDLREKFKNDPQEMIDFLKDPKNNEEAVELGLLTKLAQPNDDSTTTQQAPKSKAIPASQKPDPE